MGMSASQARLLALTSRIHDVEYKAQSIQAKKLQLANFSDAAYEKYLDALDATTLTIKRADNSVVPATFTNLCSSQGVKNSNYKGYSIRDEQGRLIVEQDVYDKLQNGGATDAYEFAALMLGVESGKLDGISAPPTNDDMSAKLTEVLEAVNGTDDKTTLPENYENIGELFVSLGELLPGISEAEIWNDEVINQKIDAMKDEGDPEKPADDRVKENARVLVNQIRTAISALMPQATNSLADAEQAAYNAYADNASSGNDLVSRHDILKEQLGNINIFDDQAVENALKEIEKKDPKEAESIRASLEEFKFDLYRTKGADIVSGAGAGTKEDYDAGLFNYYANIYKQAQSDGYVSIETFNNEAQSGATNNNEWLNEQILSGRFTIEGYSVNNNTGILDSDSVMVGAQTDITYSNRTEIDKTELARAEAEYEKAMKDINAKEKRYDHELAKLDTERQALTTQIDSLKTQISDNIDRTFGIFS